MLTFFAFILVFGMLVFFHELGHFTVAKLSGIGVIEFSLGIGNKVFSFKRGETRYSVRWIPLGGFVKLAGMDDAEDGSFPEAGRNFNEKPIHKRISTVLAGPLMNVVLAVVIFAVIFSRVGIPVVRVSDVFKGSPAQEAGLAKGDTILQVNGSQVEGIDSVITPISGSVGKPVSLLVKRGGDQVSLRVVPEYDESGKRGRIGVNLGQTTQKATLGKSVGRGFALTANVTKGIVTGLGDMITGRTKAEVSGPIGIYGMVGTTARMGWLSLMFLVAVLSVNLAIINLLPVPVLDGGWVLFLVVEGIMGRPLKPEQRGFAQFIGVAFLLFLFLFASYSDLSRLNIFDRLKDAVQGWF